MGRRKDKISRAKRFSIKRTLWILGVPTSGKTARGLVAEEKALAALEYHKKKKTKFPGSRVIKEVKPTGHFSFDDKEGKDIIVTFESGEVLPIGVQNWWSYEMIQKHRKKGICLLILKPKQDPKGAREIVYKVISQWFSDKEKRGNNKK